MKASMRIFSQSVLVGLCLFVLVVAAGAATGNHTVYVNGLIANKPHAAAAAPESDAYAMLLEGLSSIAHRLAASPGEFGLSHGLVPYFG
jgi:hypothetical protein